jgi:hypothetical protein
VAKRKQVKRENGAGIFRASGARVADFSYHPNDSLAQMIVDAWVDDGFRNLLTTGDRAARITHAQVSLAGRGLYLERPIVITEAEYAAGHDMQDDREIVLVLPNKPRAGAPRPNQSLLETARLLMACTPEGI